MHKMKSVGKKPGEPSAGPGRGRGNPNVATPTSSSSTSTAMGGKPGAAAVKVAKNADDASAKTTDRK